MDNEIEFEDAIGAFIKCLKYNTTIIMHSIAPTLVFDESTGDRAWQLRIDVDFITGNEYLPFASEADFVVSFTVVPFAAQKFKKLGDRLYNVCICITGHTNENEPISYLFPPTWSEMSCNHIMSIYTLYEDRTGVSVYDYDYGDMFA